MRSNPNAIRPRPEAITKAKSVVRAICKNLEDAIAVQKFGHLQPTTTKVRNLNPSRGRMAKVELDWKMGRDVSLVSRGGKFEIYFGPSLTPAEVFGASKTLFNNKYGPKYDKSMLDELRSALEEISTSGKVQRMHRWLTCSDPYVSTYDRNGHPMTIKVTVLIDPGLSPGLVSGIRYDQDKGPQAVGIFVPSEDSCKEALASLASPLAKHILVHELTHAVDPGIELETYLGGPDEILGTPVREVLAIAAQSPPDEAIMLRALVNEAMSKYFSGAHEVRAESGAWIVQLMRYASIFQSKEGRPMTLDELFLYLKRVRSYGMMNEDGKRRFLRYVVQALTEQGLITSS